MHADMSQFDWDMDVEELGAISIMVFDTAEPDVAVLSKTSDVDVVAEIGEQFGDAEYLQLIVINRDEETNQMCPYFRIITDTFTSSDRVNYHLQLFYKRIGMSSLNACCNKAMVVGLYDLVEMGRCISVPTKFAISSMDPEDMGLPKELDSVCLKPCASTLYKPGVTLYDIAGLSIPRWLPIEAQWNIVSFLRSPIAELVRGKMEDICYKWDLFLYTMFSQREPRIPAHIAYAYSVPTVLTTVGGATKSFLARSVPRMARNVFIN